MDEGFLYHVLYYGMRYKLVVYLFVEEIVNYSLYYDQQKHNYN